MYIAFDKYESENLAKATYKVACVQIRDLITINCKLYTTKII